MKNRSSARYFLNQEQQFAMFVIVGSPSLEDLKAVVSKCAFDQKYHTDMSTMVDLRDAELNLSVIEEHSLFLFLKHNLSLRQHVALVTCQQKSPTVARLLEESIYDEKYRIFYTIHQAREWLVNFSWQEVTPKQAAAS